MQLVFNLLISFALILLVSTAFGVKHFSSNFFDFSLAIIISLGGYFTYLFYAKFNFLLFFSITLAVFCSVIIGLFTELVVYKPMRKKNAPNYAYLIASIGLYTILQNCISIYFGDDTKTLNIGEIVVGHQFMGAFITTIQIITIVVSLLIFIGMYFLYNFTNLGKQIRAVSENDELATIYGISSDKIILICFGIGSALGAIAGILSAYDTNLTPTMGFNLLLYGVVAMIIGGVGSFRGLLLGSLLVASAQNLVAYYLDTKWMDAVAYIILIAFLLWKPLGFSGKRLRKIEI
jgi:branched-chain amino acid transport system permease protein